MKAGRLNWAKVWEQYREEIDRTEREYKAAAGPLLKQIQAMSDPGGGPAWATEARRQLDEARRKKDLEQKKALDKVKTYMRVSETLKTGDLARPATGRPA